MSKFLYLGLGPSEVVKMSTANPARVIGRQVTLVLAARAEEMRPSAKYRMARAPSRIAGATAGKPTSAVPLESSEWRHYRCGEVPPPRLRKPDRQTLPISWDLSCGDEEKVW